MTGHHPATVQRPGKGKNGPTYRATCSCGWDAPAVSHETAWSAIKTHYREATGRTMPEPAPTRRRR